MVNLARGYAIPGNSVEGHPWTADDGREVARFFAQFLLIAAAAIALYLVGPAFGLAVVAGCLAIIAITRWYSTDGKGDVQEKDQQTLAAGMSRRIGCAGRFVGDCCGRSDVHQGA